MFSQRPTQLLPQSKSLILFGVLFLSIAVLSTLDASAQEWTKRMFKEFSHDFGNVAKHSKVEYRFEIENPFEEAISIARAETSCRCTDVSLSKTILQSGEKGEVIAKFNTVAFDGFRQATITIRFAAPFVGEAQLLVKGNIRPDVVFQPGEIEFSQVNRNALPERKVNISYRGNPNWKIIDIRSTFGHIGVGLSQPMRTADNRIQYTLTTRLKDTVPSGFQTGELLVITSEGGRTQEIPIKFSGKIVSDLQVSPDVLTINASPEGEQVKKKLVLKGSAPFKIVDVTCQNTSLAVEADVEVAKKVHFVDVVYSPDQAPGHYECEMQIVTDLNSITVGKVKAVIEVSK